MSDETRNLMSLSETREHLATHYGIRVSRTTLRNWSKVGREGHKLPTHDTIVGLRIHRRELMDFLANFTLPHE